MASTSAALQRWTQDRVLKNTEVASQPGDREFTIVTYNTLADFHISGPDIYPLCQPGFLFRDGSTSNRHKLLIEEISWLDADVYCLQEIDKCYYEILEQEMKSLGYNGAFAKKADPTHEGLATFYRRSTFKAIKTATVLLSDCIDELGSVDNTDHYKTGHVMLMVALESLDNATTLVIGNTHTLWGEWACPVTTTLQIACAAQALDKFVASMSTVNRVPHILCGDLNVEPQFPAYMLLEKGALDLDALEALQGFEYIIPEPGCTLPDKLCREEVELLERLQTHLYSPLNTLKTAYKQVLGSDGADTSYNLGKGSMLDYIWYSADSLEVRAVLPVPDADRIPDRAIPSDIYSSDHLSLKAHISY